MRGGERRLPAGAEIITIGTLVERAGDDAGLRGWEIASDRDTWWNAHWAIRGYQSARASAGLAHAPSGLLIIARPAPDDDRPNVRYGNR